MYRRKPRLHRKDAVQHTNPQERGKRKLYSEAEIQLRSNLHTLFLREACDTESSTFEAVEIHSFEDSDAFHSNANRNFVRETSAYVRGWRLTLLHSKCRGIQWMSPIP